MGVSTRLVQRNRCRSRQGAIILSPISYLPLIPCPWRPLLAAQTTLPYYRHLDDFLGTEVASGKTILPGDQDLFRALQLTTPDQVKVVLLGQDPYPTPGNAHGLCFSVRPGVHPLPASLKNVFRELHEDVGFRIPNHGCLESWARKGVLMLNTVLTVPAREAAGHRGRGWEHFTDAVIRQLDARPTRVVFLLWGNDARKKSALIRQPHHRIVATAHPSPLSVRKFRGCRCFSAVNRHLTEAGIAPIDWTLPDI